MDDDYDEFFDEMKKHFNLDVDEFDVDFLFIPEPNFDPNQQPQNRDFKGFKVSYHFEPGMDKPEVRIEGNFDQKRLQDYLKKMKITPDSVFNKIENLDKLHEIDAKDLSLDYGLNRNKKKVKEPVAEEHLNDDSLEIVIEVPGIEKGHILLSLIEDNKTLKFSAESQMRRFEKNINLPFQTSQNDIKLHVKNGIAIINIKKPNK